MNILIFFIDADCSIYPVNMLEKVFVDQNNVDYGFPPEGDVMKVELPEPVTILGETIPDEYICLDQQDDFYLSK